jgi:hypothetical protein
MSEKTMFRFDTHASSGQEFSAATLKNIAQPRANSKRAFVGEPRRKTAVVVLFYLPSPAGHAGPSCNGNLRTDSQATAGLQFC